MKYEINMMDAKREVRNEDIQKLISTLQEVGVKTSIVKQKIMEKYDLSDAEVDKLLKQYN